jgi:hypothetical protein
MDQPLSGGAVVPGKGVTSVRRSPRLSQPERRVDGCVDRRRRVVVRDCPGSAGLGCPYRIRGLNVGLILCAMIVGKVSFDVSQLEVDLASPSPLGPLRR